MRNDARGSTVEARLGAKSLSELAFSALEVVLAGALKTSVAVPRIAFAMLDPDDPDIWVLDVRRHRGLFRREAPIEVGLMLTLRPRTLIELFSASGIEPNAPIIVEGDIGCLDALHQAISMPLSAIALRAEGFS